jgi:hypothetical protein
MKKKSKNKTGGARCPHCGKVMPAGAKFCGGCCRKRAVHAKRAKLKAVKNAFRKKAAAKAEAKPKAPEKTPKPETVVMGADKQANQPEKKSMPGMKDFVWKDHDGKMPYLETEVDALLVFVQQNKKVRVSEAAKRFNVPKSKVEEWGIILEDHKLVSMHYPPFGEAVIMVREEKKMRRERKNKYAEED